MEINYKKNSVAILAINDEYYCSLPDANCIQIPNKPSTPWSDYSTFHPNHPYLFKFKGSYSFNYEEKDTIRYRIDWGDGSGNQTTSFSEQNTTLQVSHRYTSVGYFSIKVTTQLYSEFGDDGWSSWSNYYTIYVWGPLGPEE